MTDDEGSLLDGIPGVAEIFEAIDALPKGKDDPIPSFFKQATQPGTERQHTRAICPCAALPSGAENYFCNLVLQGGGMLGAAHVGFICGLERAGVRFAGVAGASAGAIVAMALVCARKNIWDPTGATLFEAIRNVRTDSFIDGPRPIRRLIKSMLASPSISKLLDIDGVLKSIRRVLRKRGLNPGDAFESWLAEVLKEYGVETNLDLKERLDDVRNCLETSNLVSKFRDAPDKQMAKAGTVLKLIAAGLPIGMKFEFPADLDLFAEHYARESPATLVRASMAVPIFFDPAVFELQKDRWKEVAEERLEGLVVRSAIQEIGLADRIYMVDGGAFSNLPLDAFLDDNSLPTVAVTLISEPPAEATLGARSFKSLARDALRLFNAIKAQRDRDARNALTRQPALANRVRVAAINATGHNWLNFVASDDEIQTLFVKGLRASESFLRNLKI